MCITGKVGRARGGGGVEEEGGSVTGAVGSARLSRSTTPRLTAAACMAKLGVAASSSRRRLGVCTALASCTCRIRAVLQKCAMMSRLTSSGDFFLPLAKASEPPVKGPSSLQQPGQGAYSPDGDGNTWEIHASCSSGYQPSA